ncbi:MAG TPA: hypothetical protein PK413_20695, partial [Thermoanaerobaculia bacterium]|nr:hypothetical protein [Thermoanaerobaculia bacterium]
HVWQQPTGEFPLHPKPTAQPPPPPYFDDDADALCSPLEALAHAVLEFLSVLTSVPQLHNAVRLSTHHLTNALFHFMLVGEGELAGWKANPTHFTTQGATYDYELTVRSKCLSILNELIEKFGDLAIQALLVISEKFLLNLNEEATTSTLNMIAGSLTDLAHVQAVSGGVFESAGKFGSLVQLSSCNVREQLKVSGESWRKVEVSLLVLGRFAEDIIVFQSKQGGAFDIEAFVRGIVRQVREEDYYSLLKGQSLYCLTRFTEIISIKYRHLFGELVVAAAAANNAAAPLPLRVVACKALSMFLKKIDKHRL